jgi:prepilin-type processing-associated H-X9-DG protein
MKQHVMDRPKRAAFREYLRASTLIELLLAIAIIGILAATLLPARVKAEVGAHQVECLASRKHSGNATQMYMRATTTSRQVNQTVPLYARSTVHGGGANVRMLDGHVKRVCFKKLRQLDDSGNVAHLFWRMTD